MDDAEQPLTSVAAPFEGTYKPYRQLSQFYNTSPNGDWILEIYDRSTGNSGTLLNWCINIIYGTSIGIEPVSTEIPSRYNLSQNYPNPFNPLTKIRFSIPERSDTKLIIYDLQGREIQKLVDESLSGGTYEVNFDASGFASGVYFCKLIAGNFIETRKMVLVK